MLVTTLEMNQTPESIICIVTGEAVGYFADGDAVDAEKHLSFVKEHAMAKMKVKAEKLSADGIVGVRFSFSAEELSEQHVYHFLVSGTAVRFQQGTSIKGSE